MADIYGSHFEYGGVLSRTYGLMLANVETSRYTSVAGTINGVTTYNKKELRRYLIADDTTESPLTFDVDIVTDNDVGLEFNTRREVEKWLFNRHEYKKLYIDTIDDHFGESYEFEYGMQKRLFLNCRFVNPTRLEYNGGIVGYRATLEADTGFWWQDAITRGTQTFNDDINDVTNFTLHVDSDIDDYIYPKVTIEMGDNGGDIIIANASDDETRLTKFVDLSPNSTFILKGYLNYVSDDNYSKFDKQNFPRLLDGDNNFVIMGNVAFINFEWNNRRML